MTQTYIIPIQPSAPQRFRAVLGTATYNFRVWWSPAQQCWCLDLSDANRILLIGSIALVTGADLLEQYRYLNIGGGLLVLNTSGPPDIVPGYNAFGVTSQLLFFPYE